MATIHATCDQCNTDAELTAPDITVVVCVNTNQGTYTFTCPHCHARAAKQAVPRVVDLLLSTGCRLWTWHWPLELDERHDGPPITWDDIIDLHDLLAEDGWQERIRA